MEGKCVLPLDTKIAFYRIAQEALNNIAKHAAAEQVEVTLTCREGVVELRVRDDGVGIAVEAPDVSITGGTLRKNRGAGIRVRAVDAASSVVE